jgi:tetratricopeptide (TPR) repeat protein
LADKPGAALESFRKALAIDEKLAEANPGVTEFRNREATYHRWIAATLQATGKSREALESHGKALAILQQLADANPAVTRYQSELAGTLHNAAMVKTKLGQSAEALAMYERAIALSEAATKANPTVTQYALYLGKHYWEIRELLWDAGKRSKAFESCVRELASWQSLADANPEVIKFQDELAESHVRIGLLLAQTGQPAEAAVAFGGALTAMRRQLELRPKSAGWTPEDALIVRYLASLYLLTGDRPGFARYCEGLLERSDTGPPTDVALNLAWACAHGDGVVDTARVIRLVERAVARQPELPWYHNALACALLRAGRYEDALRSLDDADRLKQDWSATPLNDLVRAIVQGRLGRTAAARASYGRAVSRAGHKDGKVWYGVRLPGAPLCEPLTFEVLRREAEGLILDAIWPADPFTGTDPEK